MDARRTSALSIGRTATFRTAGYPSDIHQPRAVLRSRRGIASARSRSRCGQIPPPKMVEAVHRTGQAIDVNRRYPKKPKKCLATPTGIVRRGLILRALGGHMRKFNKFWPMRSCTFRSLLVVAGVFLLTAAL